MPLAKHINGLSAEALQTALTKCCAARRWVSEVAAARPFDSDQQLLQKASEAWNRLNREDFLEAFSAHAKIGDVASLRQKYSDTRQWAGNEQSGVAAANEDILQHLAELNREYEHKFGYIFIVCATGKSAAEMLAILESRLPNTSDVELNCAAAEQLKITLLRLKKLIP